MWTGEEAGWCAWTLYEPFLACVVTYVCASSPLRQSFDRSPLELLTQMLSPDPGLCRIPGCSPGRLTAHLLLL